MIDIITTLIAALIRIRWCLLYANQALSRTTQFQGQVIPPTADAWIVPGNFTTTNFVRAQDTIRLEVVAASLMTIFIVILGLEEHWYKPRSVLATILFILVCGCSGSGLLVSILTAPQLTANLLISTRSLWTRLHQPVKKLVKNAAQGVQHAMASTKKNSSVQDDFSELPNLNDQFPLNQNLGPTTPYRTNLSQANLDNKNSLKAGATNSQKKPSTQPRPEIPGSNTHKQLQAPPNTANIKRDRQNAGSIRQSGQ